MSWAEIMAEKYRQQLKEEQKQRDLQEWLYYQDKDYVAPSSSG